MPVKVRKFIGMLLTLVVLFAYIILAVQIVDLMPSETNMALQVLVYTLAGILWVVPAGLIISWMSKQN